MSLTTICRLCLKDCNEFKTLYSAHGQANELYEMTLAYFHPKIVDMEEAKHLRVICLECVGHMDDFNRFQESIRVAQSNLRADLHQVIMKKERKEDRNLEGFQQTPQVDSNALGPIGMEVDRLGFSVDSLSNDNGMDNVLIKTEVETSKEFENRAGLSIANVTTDHEPIKMEEGEVISKDFHHPPTFKVEERLVQDATAFDGIIKSDTPQDSGHNTRTTNVEWQQSTAVAPMPCIATTLATDTTDFTTAEPKLEIIDVPEPDQSSTEDEDYSLSQADISPAAGGGSDTTKRPIKHTCAICGHAFTGTFNYMGHMRRQHGKDSIPAELNDKGQMFKCDICHNYFASRKNLNGHLKRKHGINTEATSHRECDIDYDATAKKFNCKLCGKCYALRMHINQHMELAHAEVEQAACLTLSNEPVSTEPAGLSCEVFKCKLCDYACEFKGSLRRHMVNLHNITAPKFEFDYEEATKLFSCKLCQASFRYENSLKKHMEQTHWEQDDVSQKFEFDYDEASKVFICKLCSSSQKDTASLVTHMASHHWITPNAKSACLICQNDYLTKLGLAQHYNDIHCPPGVFPCTVCGNTFKKHRLLQQHKRQIHSSYPKPHKCDTCGKTFRTPSELKRHLLSHTSNKIFSCKFCPIKFKYSPNLVQHTKRVHPHEASQQETGISDDEQVGVSNEAIEEAQL